ncbi:hypothetical protein AGMMS49992_31650 [Clostridia bacterium]|nr:hypothetical protein AGMMS49992_31650 [Clostridia bacterium]
MNLLGIDGGGTKTDMLLCDETGRTLCQARGGPTNPSSVSLASIQAELESLLAQMRIDAPVSCYAGISGCGIESNRAVLHTILEPLLPKGSRLICGSDAVNALNSGLGRKDGIVAIAGTGSNVVVRVGDTLTRVGGWGHLLGDEGSGFALGRMALQAVLRAYDGRGQPTLLTRLCQERFGQPIQDGVTYLYAEGHAAIASFAPCLLEAAEQGDAVALACAMQEAQSMAEMIQAASTALRLPIQGEAMLPHPPDTRAFGRFALRINVVLAGSVWPGFMERTVGRLLGDVYRLMRPVRPPVYGAVLEAAHQAGIAHSCALITLQDP